MNIINGKPVKAFVYQDHESHIMAHKAMLEDPKVMELMSQSPNAESAAAGWLPTCRNTWRSSTG